VASCEKQLEELKGNEKTLKDKIQTLNIQLARKDIELKDKNKQLEDLNPNKPVTLEDKIMMRKSMIAQK
jgi:predicted  nucleic acid-binding Zn-ribbon protein